MSISPDIRRPCGSEEGPIIPFRGNCFNHFKDNSSVRYLVNNTKVKDYVNPANYVDPYAVAVQDGAPDCSPYNNGGCPDNPCYECGDGLNGNLYCWPLDPTYYANCGGSQQQLNIGNYHNCFNITETTYSNSGCRDYGWKGVYGSKTFSGRKSYTSREYGVLDSSEWCCSCGRHDIDATADQTRYLALSATVSTQFDSDAYSCSTTVDGEVCCPDLDCIPNNCTTCTFTGTTTWTGTAAAATHVDIYGNIYSDLCTSGSTGGDATSQAVYSAAAFGRLGDANTNVTNLWAVWCTNITLFTGLYGSPTATSGTGGSRSVTFSTHNRCTDECGNEVSNDLVSAAVMTITPTTLDVYTYGPQTDRDICYSDGNCASWVQTGHEHFSYSATDFSYSGDFTGYGSISFDQRSAIDVNASLSSPYTSTQVKAALNNILLAQWDMGDHVVYPWRHDLNITKGPYVCYDEGTASPTVPVCTSSIQYTGQIRGAPYAPVINGIKYVPDRIWNPYHENYCICDSLVTPGCMSFYVQSRGAYSTDIGVPCATQWTNNFIANNFPQGAFMGNNFMYSVPSTCNSSGPQLLTNDTMWAAKYAWIIFPKESYNYARPCGEDRFQPAVGTSGHCIVSVVGNTINIEPSGAATDIVTGDYVIVGGIDSAHDGVWKATKNSDYQITIHDLLVSGSSLPTQPIANYGEGMVKKLRWQTLQPAICGRLDIASVSKPTSSGSLVTCSLFEDTYLVNNDQIQIVGSKGFPEINSIWNVEVIDPRTIALRGSNTLPDGKVYLGKGQMYSTFAPDWKWNDTSTKGNYKTITWINDWRSVDEYARLVAQKTVLDSTFKCDGVTPCDSPALPAVPRAKQLACGMDNSLETTCHTICSEYTACRPMVGYFSPNTESFDPSGSTPTAINHGFGDVPIDNQYGAMWKGVVKQSMDDPLASTPPCPCETDDFGAVNCSGFQWLSDDGTCLNDNPLAGFKYFPAANQYEAMCEPPEGAPPLPSGSYIGCLNSSQFVDGRPCPQGNICSPPSADANAVFDNGAGCQSYISFPYELDFYTYLLKYGCVCSDGRFASEYEANGIACDNLILPPPF